jgi:dolichol-phosphate mannosyltransferase
LAEAGAEESRCDMTVSDAPASITVVVPTFQEALNIPNLVQRLQRVREEHRLDLELLLMDDDSRDGSHELIESMSLPWVQLVTRRSNRSLSEAVLDGLRRSRRDVLVVMDADLSHPPEKIPEMIAALNANVEMVVGSRFTEGGSTADDWGVLRWLNSRIATLLALPLTRLSDPMSGFFALRRSTFELGCDFSPIGYKILLELIVKCHCVRIGEVPIHFDNRRFGVSKLSFKEQLRYVQHLRRLYNYRYGTWSYLIQFLVVGFSGLIVNIVALTFLLGAEAPKSYAVAAAIAVSMLWNFGLNRRFSFSYARDRPIVRQFLGYIAACSVGAAVNYLATLWLWESFQHKQIPALIGVLIGTGFNFTANRFVIFRSKHVRR